MEEAFAPVEARYRAQVMGETWGHLAPQARTKYKGSVLFAHSVYGGDGTTVIRTDFQELPDSPWFYEGLHELAGEHRSEHGDDVEGGVYLWTGYYELRDIPAVLDDDGYPVMHATYEHVWTGTFRTVVDPDPS